MILEKLKKTAFLVSMYVGLVGFAETSLAQGKSEANDSTFQAIMSTKFDFSETSVNGQMKAPAGFFLQGRQPQSLSQMVKLRSKFDRELRNSRSGVKSVVK